jgi:hypothetical protein
MELQLPVGFVGHRWGTLDRETVLNGTGLPP